MRKYDYVIFDFDGTVTDTGEGILKSLQYSFKENGRPVPSFDELKKFIGPPIHYSFVTFYNVSEDEVTSYIEKYRERYRSKGIYECKLYDGMIDLLEQLKSKDVKIGIASSKPVKLIHDVMNTLGITNMFDAVSGTQFDDSHQVSKTELILNAMQKLGVTDKSRALMVGDRYFDIDGAHGAGIDCCAVLYGYGSQEEFKEHNAEYIVSATKEIAELVLN